MSPTNLCIWQLSQLDRGRPEGVDGEEEPRSGGVVTAERAPDDDTGSGAPGEALADGETVADGDAPPGTAVPDDSSVSADEPEPDQTGDDALEAEASPADVAPADDSPDDAPVEAQPRSDDVDVPVAAARTRRRTHVRRGLVAAGVALLVAMSVSAF